MCGLVGVIGLTNLSLAARNYFQQALYADALRGYHSTGIFYKRRGATSPEVFKKAVSAADFLDMGRVADIFKESNNYSFMFGHNRHATRGSLTNANAHPFQHGHITLAHNGTVYPYSSDLPEHTRFDTDSEAIAYGMSVKGEKEVLESLDGAYALTWYNANEGTINLARNSERPLHIGINKLGDELLLASESDMLKWIAERTNFTLDKQYYIAEGEWFKINIRQNKIKDWDMEKFTPYESKSWQSGRVNSATSGGYNGKKSETTVIQGTKKKGKKDEIKRYTHVLFERAGVHEGQIITVQPFRFIPYQNTHGDKNIGKVEAAMLTNPFLDVDLFAFKRENYNHEACYEVKVVGVKQDRDGSIVLTATEPKEVPWEDVLASSTPLLEGPTEKKSEEGGDVYYSHLKGPGGIFISNKTWKAKVSNGCSLCGKPISEHDHDYVMWEGNEPICKECVTDWNKETVVEKMMH